MFIEIEPPSLQPQRGDMEAKALSTCLIDHGCVAPPELYFISQSVL